MESNYEKFKDGIQLPTFVEEEFTISVPEGFANVGGKWIPTNIFFKYICPLLFHRRINVYLRIKIK